MIEKYSNFRKKQKKTVREIIPDDLIGDGSILPLASGFRLLLALYAGLFVMFALTNFSQHPSPRTLTLKPLESAFQRLVFVDMNLRHLFSLPSRISPETAPFPRRDAD